MPGLDTWLVSRLGSITLPTFPHCGQLYELDNKSPGLSRETPRLFCQGVLQLALASPVVSESRLSGLQTSLGQSFF